jgi:hypothetical protein
MSKSGNVAGAPTGTVVTVHAVLQRADGTTEDLGVIASSDPTHTPLTPRKEQDGPQQR